MAGGSFTTWSKALDKAKAPTPPQRLGDREPSSLTVILPKNGSQVPEKDSPGLRNDKRLLKKNYISKGQRNHLQ